LDPGRPCDTLTSGRVLAQSRTQLKTITQQDPCLDANRPNTGLNIWSNTGCLLKYTCGHLPRWTRSESAQRRLVVKICEWASSRVAPNLIKRRMGSFAAWCVRELSLSSFPDVAASRRLGGAVRTAPVTDAAHPSELHREPRHGVKTRGKSKSEAATDAKLEHQTEP
jgi:hypothetical protein